MGLEYMKVFGVPFLSLVFLMIQGLVLYIWNQNKKDSAKDFVEIKEWQKEAGHKMGQIQDSQEGVRVSIMELKRDVHHIFSDLRGNVAEVNKLKDIVSQVEKTLATLQEWKRMQTGG